MMRCMLRIGSALSSSLIPLVKDYDWLLMALPAAAPTASSSLASSGSFCRAASSITSALGVLHHERIAQPVRV